MDGKTHFMSKDGIYSNVERLSDLIEPDIEAINTETTDVIQNSWDTQGDFARGEFFGTTPTAAGFVVPTFGDPIRMNYMAQACDSCFPDGAIRELTSTTTVDTGFGIRLPTETISPSFRGYETGLTVHCRRIFASGGTGDPTINLTIRNLRTNAIVSYQRSIGSANFTKIIFAQSANTTTVQNIFFSGDELATSSYSVRMEAAIDANVIFQYYPSTTTGFSDILLTPATTGQFVSEVSTLTTPIVGWGLFDSVRNTNGGSISYYHRTSTSAVNITTQPWTGIVPGAVINAPIINNYIQWASTITSVGTYTAVASNIDEVTIDHLEGQASDARAFGISWKNRYWLAVTTTADTTKRLIYVGSRSGDLMAWMPIEGIPANCFARAGDVLYGGSVSTGIVFRLDNGTNFDGAAINRIYDTPDLALGSGFFDKNVIKYVVDGVKSGGGTMTLGTSANGGAFSNTTYSFSGTGRYSRVVEGKRRPAKTLRLRFQNMQTDVDFDINSINVLYENTGTLSNQ